MSPLACSEMYALKLGHDPGRRQATRYQPCRGYRAATLFLFSHLPCCAIIRFSITPFPAVTLAFFLRTVLLYYCSSLLPCYAVFPLFAHHFPCYYLFFSHLPCCSLIPLFDYHLPAVTLFFFALTVVRHYFFFTLTLLCPYPAFRFTTYPAVALFF